MEVDRPLPAAAVAAIEAGQLIGAIKIIREEWGFGLKAAKDAVDGYVAGRAPAVAAQGGSSLPAAAVAAIEAGNKIVAIKIVREEWRLGLREAKDAVDAYGPGREGVFVAPRAREFADSPMLALGLTVLMVALAAAAYFLLRSR